METLADYARSYCLNVKRVHPEYYILRDSPQLANALLSEHPALFNIVQEVESAIPLPPTVPVTVTQRFYRLPNHWRSVCFSLGSPSDALPMLAKPVLVFKGLEPFLQDFGEYLSWMAHTRIRRAPLPIAELFPFSLSKAPGVVSMNELRRECRASDAVQASHLQHYGTFARIPIPIVVHRSTSEDVSICLETLRQRLLPEAFDRVQSYVEGGIGFGVFYYPRAPVRVADLDYRQLFEGQLESFPSAESVVNKWVSLTARLLILRFMPHATWNYGTGCCLDTGNACVDGGICDLDSIVSFGLLSDNHNFYRSLYESIEFLRVTISKFLGLERQDADQVFRQLSTSYVKRLLIEACEKESQSGLSVDPRVMSCLGKVTEAALHECVQGRELGRSLYGASG